MTQRSPFRYSKTSPEVIRLAMMLCIRLLLPLRNLKDLLDERGIEVSHETYKQARTAALAKWRPLCEA